MSSNRPRLLDLFCCEGGAGEGYRRAGFDIVGVDIDPMPTNPHTFIQADALEYLAAHGHEYDAIHASPPCQAFSVATKAWNGRINRAEHVNHIPAVRELLIAWGGPYIIENVPGAPLFNPIQLCGSSFGLAVQRHRLFESNVPMMGRPCAHHLQQERKYPPTRSDRTELARVVSVFGAGGGRAKNAALWAEAMQIEWMTKHGLAQAIPPAYTEYLGEYLLAAVNQEEIAA
jgi:DNA (cytosine-5)-methyltransferase 1